VIRIVTDSTCDLPEELIRRHRITVVPVNIQFGQQSYQEAVTLSRDEFYRMVESLNMVPQTSQPSPGQFQEAYGALSRDPATDAIVSVHLTGRLSGTVDSAVLAAEQMPPAPPIATFDSRSGSMGLGFMALEAAELAEAGAGLEQIMARLDELRRRMTIFFSLNDLRFAQMSGRVGAVRAILVSLLDIKPMLTITEGEIKMVRRVRTRAQAIPVMADALADALGNRPARLAVIHAQAPDVAEQIRQILVTQIRPVEVLVRDLSIGIAVHFGPGTVGVVGYTL
jgi:DegV family protein with EDD domain